MTPPIVWRVQPVDVRWVNLARASAIGRRGVTAACVSLSILVGGCSSAPVGPTVLVLPKRGSTLAAFTIDDDRCRAFATTRSEGQGWSRAGRSIAGPAAAALGVLGAGVGGLLDGWPGALRGGALGAGLGALTGLAASGASPSGGVQGVYDNAYIQCMASAGYRLPQSAAFKATEADAKPETLQIGVSRR